MNIAILNTRFSPKNQAFSQLLRTQGFAEIIEFPTTEIKQTSAAERAQVLQVFREQGTASWLIFTSPNGVEKTKELLAADFSTLTKGKKVAVIGAKTALAARNAGLEVTFTAENSNSKNFGEELLTYFKSRTTGDTANTNTSSAEPALILLRGDLASNDFAEGLAETGFKVFNFCVYQTTRPNFALEQVQQLAKKLGLVEAGTKSDNYLILLTFCSSQAARNLLEILATASEILPTNWREKLKTYPVAVLGSTTAKTVSDLGFNLEIIASDTNVETLAADIAQRYANLLTQTQ